MGRRRKKLSLAGDYKVMSTENATTAVIKKHYYKHFIVIYNTCSKILLSFIKYGMFFIYQNQLIS